MREEPLPLNKGSHSYYSNEDAEIMSDFTIATESRRHSNGKRPFHIVTEKDVKGINIMEMGCLTCRNRADIEKVNTM